MIRFIGDVEPSSDDIIILQQFVGVELLQPIPDGHDGRIGDQQCFECKVRGRDLYIPSSPSTESTNAIGTLIVWLSVPQSKHGIHVPTNACFKVSPEDLLSRMQELVANLQREARSSLTVAAGPTSLHTPGSNKKDIDHEV